MSTLPRPPSNHSRLSFYRASNSDNGTGSIETMPCDVADIGWTLCAEAADAATKQAEGSPALDTEKQAAFREELSSRPATRSYSRTFHSLCVVAFVVLAVLETVLTFTISLADGFDKEVSSDPFQSVKVS